MLSRVFKEPRWAAVWARLGEGHISLPSQYDHYRMQDGYERTWDTLPCDKGVAIENAGTVKML